MKPPDPRRVFVKTPSTFHVEERLPFHPSGEGEHRFLRIRMAGRSTSSLLSRLREEIPVGALGYAGLKDRDATVVQWLSVHRDHETRAREILEDLGVEILEIRSHRHKLRPGKVQANRFVLQGVRLSPGEVVDLQMQGFPNRYGPQRFARDNLERARDLVDRIARGERLSRRFEARFLLSVFQAWCFNRMVDLREERGWLRKVLPGDWVVRRPGGRPYLYEEEAVDVRPDRIPTHLLPGKKEAFAGGAPGELEREVLEEAGLAPVVLQRIPVRGTRRAVIAFPEAVIPREDGLEVVLPSGAYATVLLERLGYRVVG